MVKSRALVCLAAMAVIFSGLSFAASAAADRITGDLATGAKIRLRGNVQGLARPESDLGRADSSRMLHVVSLSFQPSAAQQNDLNLFIQQLGDPTSPSYRKYLTPAQFADRYGMTQNDINKIVAWLQSEGFFNITVSNSRNLVSFDGTVAQVESTFALEMHNYLVNGEVHLANAGEPSVPAALAGVVLSVGHLHDFSPKPRVKMWPHFTSYISGNHFLSPADFATIYNVTPLYTAGNTGAGQKIAVVGQSTVAATDLANFRSAAQLPAATVTMNSSIVGSLSSTPSTPMRCPGDEGESDLDLEWSNGVAKGASVTFVFAPVSNGDTCAARQGLNVWDALHAAIQNNVAPFISTSYGFCESNTVGITLSQAQTYRGWAQQAITQGQTITAASGDAGAADCDTTSPATGGLAVDVPASIPEVTGAGGNEFTGDSPTYPNNNPQPPGDNPPYWAPALSTSDTISSALEYIPEEAWNDDAASIAANGSFSASGGGASAFFSKPTWQTGTGVPSDGKRDVPDVSINASADHDGYLVCSEDGANGTIVPTCTNGFRDSGSNLDVVGGTSAAAPTFTAILALINQFVGNTPPTGLAPVNPMLYKLAAGSPSSFHDVTLGDNKVPCTTSTPNCTTGTM
ncbi:MAG TPA: S53 family peptidase, partial [Candidatus Binatia bacterium]|nr:S53 family peptidase [Candidatus Binatia bacterium]